MSSTSHAITLARAAARAADDKHATDIVGVDVSALLPITDVFVLCSAGNGPQLSAITDEVERKVRDAGGGRPRREGGSGATWVLLDFGDIVVHVQTVAERDAYGLERLWQDCPQLDLQLSAAG